MPSAQNAGGHGLGHGGNGAGGYGKGAGHGIFGGSKILPSAQNAAHAGHGKALPSAQGAAVYPSAQSSDKGFFHGLFSRD